MTFKCVKSDPFFYLSLSLLDVITISPVSSMGNALALRVFSELGLNRTRVVMMVNHCASHSVRDVCPGWHFGLIC